MCVSLYRQLHFPKHVRAYPRWIMIRRMHPNIEKNEKKKKEKIFIVSLDLVTSMYQCMVIWLFKTENMNLRFVKLASVFKNDSFLLGKKIMFERAILVILGPNLAHVKVYTSLLKVVWLHFRITSSILCMMRRKRTQKAWKIRKSLSFTSLHFKVYFLCNLYVHWHEFNYAGVNGLASSAIIFVSCSN